MKEIVINSCYGGFGLPPEATLELYARGVTEIATPVGEYFSDDDRYAESEYFGKANALKAWRDRHNSERNIFLTVFSPDEQFVLYARGIARDNETLLAVVKEMGETANGDHAGLRIVEIPDDVEWVIEEYDGREWVAEKHRTWS